MLQLSEHLHSAAPPPSVDYPAAPHTLAPEHLPPYLCQWLVLAMAPAGGCGGTCAPKLALAMARHPATEALLPFKGPLESLEARGWAYWAAEQVGDAAAMLNETRHNGSMGHMQMWVGGGN
jgi:hypothetical protein